MLYLSFIWHMHQPYYKELDSNELFLPWVRLHGTKDYLDMVQILDQYPKIKQVFNFVPSLVDQINDYTLNGASDRFMTLSLKRAEELSPEEKSFLLQNFFMLDAERVISLFPRYYELLFKRNQNAEFTAQDFRDLQVWFNLAWIDPTFRHNIPTLRNLVEKGRFFTEEEKAQVLEEQINILKRIIPTYQQFAQHGQIEITTTPYYHPILPLLFNTAIAKETAFEVALPKKKFAYPEDVKWQVEAAVKHSAQTFGISPQGMWPSEQAVSEHILPFIINSGIKWIVCDEAILLKSLHRKKRKPELLYKPYRLDRKEGALNVIFRDRNLSDLIGFVYHRWDAKSAVENLLEHLHNIAGIFPDQDALVTIALDGENAWEYYRYDGSVFLNLLYQRLTEENWIKTETISGYLATHQPADNLKRLSPGSWIYGDFNKWIGKREKNIAWTYLADARGLWETKKGIRDNETLTKALRQLYVAEGSDWFWWYADNPGAFDVLFRKHLTNFYKIIGEVSPSYLSNPI